MEEDKEMGPIVSAERVALGFMDSFKRDPLALALIAMNLCLLGFFYFILDRVAAQRKEEVTLLYIDKRETRELLAKCIVPDIRRPTTWRAPMTLTPEQIMKQ